MKFWNTKCWGSLTVVLATLLVILFVGSDVAASYATVINNTFGIETSRVEGASGDQYTYFSSDYDDAESLAAYLKQAGIDTEAEGLVLLKNDNGALPLNEGDRVSLVMTAAAKFNYSSSGSSAAETSGYPSLKAAMEESGFEVNGALWDFYTAGDAAAFGRYTMGNTYLINEAGWDVYTDDVIASFDEYGTVIAVIARDSGEGKDISVVKSDGENGSYLCLSAQEVEVLEHLTAMKAEGSVQKIIVLLNSSAPIQLDFLYRDGIDVDACLWVGNVGSSGIYAIGQALTGAVVPSGRLSDTYLKNNFASPAMANWTLNAYSSFSAKYTNGADYALNSTQENYGVYIESIYVGYRYYETRYEDSVMGNTDYSYEDDVAYPFGYGLSYTSFEYSGFSVTENDGSFDVSLTVKNTGDAAGKDVVQVYLQKPYTDYDREHGIEKAAVELAGFAKTEALEPGASETVTITVQKEQFKCYDADGFGTYILEDGDYYLTAARNAHEAADNILASKGYDTEGNKDDVYLWNNPSLDSETYSVSRQTGAAIVNLFDDSDVNRYAGSGDNRITYVSRSDWEGTWPAERIELSIATDQMAEDIGSSKALPETDDALPVYGADNGLTLAALRSSEENPIPYDDELWDKLLDQMTLEDQMALVTTGQYSTLAIQSVGKPATLENDGPTGVASTTTSTSFPSEGIWAASWNTEIMEAMGNAIAEDAMAAGVNGMYAGGVNIHRTPFDGRSHEYFSEDPLLSGIAIQHEVIGMQSKGVVAHVKHLAFNDEETNRNGIGIWLNEQEAREIMLVPFEYGLSEDLGGAGAVMTSFNRIGVIWAGAHSGLLTDLIHGEWGFHGFNITDMAASNGAFYMTYQDGIINGTDLYLGSGEDISDLAANAAFALRLREACHNILYTIVNRSNAMNGLGVETIVSAVTPWWQTALRGILIGVGVLTLCSVCLYAVSWKKKYKA